MNILVAMPDTELREHFFPQQIRERLEELGTIEWNSSTDNFTESQLQERIPGFDVLVTGWGSPIVTDSVLSAGDELELIAHTGGSVAGLASEAVYDADIRVVSANDTMADYTAEHTLALILGKLRAVPELDASMKSGEWGAEVDDIRTMHGTDIGLIGFGAIGRKLLSHLESFDITAKIYDPYVDETIFEGISSAERVDMDEALDSTVVSIHAARTPETIGMIDADRLSKIPDDALLVNTARAEIVVEDALLAELRSGRFSAVLDVYHEEPLPPGHELRTLENVVLTPHVGGSKIRPPLTETILDDIERFQNGESLDHKIPRAKWELMTR